MNLQFRILNLQMTRVAAVLLWVLCGYGCHHPASPAPTTGLTGTVVRGPITPVCRIDIPCDAPFSATFNVQEASKHVASFQSASDGHFTVFLAPGIYQVIPGPTAPLIAPVSQVKTVEVEAAGLTVVQLDFDT